MKGDFSYIFGEIRRNWKSNHWWVKQMNVRLNSKYYSALNVSPGDAVIPEDWDNLIILDACRYDLFEDVIGSFSIDGNLEKRISLGSATREFLRENFSEGTYNDVVYVTANPFVKTELLRSTFHDVDHVWLDAWDEEEGTVMPEKIATRTLNALDKYPNKRIISHFMQPHYPFIGDERIESDRGVNGLLSLATGEKVPEEEAIWSQLRRGKVGHREVWNAYHSNLVFVLNSVEELIDNLQGMTVITSDHGNSFGTRVKPIPTTVYGHAEGIRIPELVEVPWYVCDIDSRRPITNEASNVDRGPGPDEGLIQDRLESLGYMN